MTAQVVPFTPTKPEDQALRDWVLNAVLPAIRQTRRHHPPAPPPTLTDEQWVELRTLIHRITLCCHCPKHAEFALNERIRAAHGLRSTRALRPEHYPEVKHELERLLALAEQHRQHLTALEHQFVATVLRPPVSIRQVRALARRQGPPPAPVP